MHTPLINIGLHFFRTTCCKLGLDPHFKCLSFALSQLTQKAILRHFQDHIRSFCALSKTIKIKEYYLLFPKMIALQS